MKLTRYAHACVRLETPGGPVVIDSGAFTDAASVDGAVALLYTHAHYDHVESTRIAQLRTANASVDVLAAEGAAEACGVDDVVRLTPGELVDVAGVPVMPAGGRHAEIYPGADAGDNVALLVAGRIFHPGDSFTLPPSAVETLLLPLQAPWSRLSETVDYVRAVAPQRVIPIHDALLSEVGVAAFDRNIVSMLGSSVAYRRLEVGESCDA